jgi:hypothetical protein
LRLLLALLLQRLGASRRFLRVDARSCGQDGGGH